MQIDKDIKDLRKTQFCWAISFLIGTEQAKMQIVTSTQKLLIYGLHSTEIHNGDRLLDPFQLKGCLISKSLGGLITPIHNSASPCVF